MHDSDNINDYLADYFAKSEIKRHLNIGIANVLDGEFVNFNEHTSHDDLVKVL